MMRAAATLRLPHSRPHTTTGRMAVRQRLDLRRADLCEVGLRKGA